MNFRVIYNSLYCIIVIIHVHSYRNASVVHDCIVGMTFHDPRAQLTLHMWLNFGRYFLNFFYRTLERRGYSFRFRIQGIERLPLRSLPSIACCLIIFFMLMLLVRIPNSESEESTGRVFCSYRLFQHLWLISSCSPFHELQTQTKQPVQSNES